MNGLRMLNSIANATSAGAGSGFFSSSSASSSSTSSNQLHGAMQNFDDNIIRISAKTAPQIVSSVPKCRNPKSSRSYHPLESLNGPVAMKNQPSIVDNTEYVQHANGAHRSTAFMVPEHNNNNSNHHHYVKHQLGRRDHNNKLGLPLDGGDDQMVLIVNDDNKGAPIIGRRLPSKSMMSRHNGQPQQLPPEVRSAGSSMVPASFDGPVVGRRSHRLIQQQRAGHMYHQYERALEYHYQSDHYHPNSNVDSILMESHSSSSSSSTNALAKSNETYAMKQQPLSIIETQVPISQQVLASANQHKQQQQRPLKVTAKSKLKSKVRLAAAAAAPPPLASSSDNLQQVARGSRGLESLSMMNLVAGASSSGEYDAHLSMDNANYEKPSSMARAQMPGGGSQQQQRQNHHHHHHKPPGCKSTHQALLGMSSPTLASSSSLSLSSSSSSRSSPPSCPAGCPCGQLAAPPYLAGEPEHDGGPAANTCDDSSCHCHHEGSLALPAYESTIAADSYLPSVIRSASCQRLVRPTGGSCCTANIPREQRLSHLPAASATRAADCRQRLTTKGYQIGNHVTSSSSIGSQGRQQAGQQQQQMMLPIEATQKRNLGRSSQRPTRSQISHHHYHYNNYHLQSCQHELAGPPAVSCAVKPAPGASNRSSSCHEPRMLSQPMPLRSLNVLPVHPKPAISSIQNANSMMQVAFPVESTTGRRGEGELLSLAGGIGRGRKANSSQELASQAARRREQVAHARAANLYLARAGSPETELDGGVSQMYESLAAELKAKLGDPKMGPILLPPKDYDTMSRKQGKLTGIELRRSTNPQLVGPSVTKINRQHLSHHSTAKGQSCSIIKEEGSRAGDTGGNGGDVVRSPAAMRASVPSGGGDGESPVCGGGSSSRSSGRSQDNLSLHRSRSNSSSGLGSISMGAGSPNSSPSSKSSSSEDMRQSSRRLIGHPHTIRTSNNLPLDSPISNFTKIVIGRSSGSGCSQSSSQSSSHGSSQRVANGGRGPAPINGQSHMMSINRHVNELQQQQNKINESAGQECNRKSLSPDYCGASDSGHSEIGPMSGTDQLKPASLSNSSDTFPRSAEGQPNVTTNSNSNSNTNTNTNNDNCNNITSNHNKQDKCANNNKRTSAMSPRTNAGMQHHNPSVVSEGVLWNGRVEVPLKVNRNKNNGNTYLATKQIIY